MRKLIALIMLMPLLAIADIRHELIVSVGAKELPSNEIRFSWEDFGAELRVYRIPAGAVSWGSPIALIPAQNNTWVDSTAEAGKLYEYRFESIGGSPYIHYQARQAYIYAGANIPPVTDRGVVIIVVQDTLLEPLSDELGVLDNDMVADGYTVKRFSVSSLDKPAVVRDRIKAVYEEEPARTKHLYLLGNVPVIKAGCIAPDGHNVYVQPTDTYYGDLDGNWSDIRVNCTPTKLKPDKHLDQNVAPSDLELGVGRVDFTNIPAYTETPTELIRRYLNKAHAYKTRQFVPKNRSIIFNTGQSLTANLNIVPMLGSWDILDINVKTKPATKLWSVLENDSYLWLWKGGGGGTTDGMAQIGRTAGFALSPGVNVPFWGVLGSGNQKWTNKNAFSKGVIAAKGQTLVYIWADRPVWRLHGLAVGQTFGDAMRATFSDKYSRDSFYFRGVQASIQGDPTLRLMDR